MLRLVIEDGEGTTHVVPLIRDEITVGREEGNTIRLTERNVSRRHARLVRNGVDETMTVLVQDLDSYNGVRVNGNRIIGQCSLAADDTIQIGDYLLALEAKPLDTPDRNDVTRVTSLLEPSDTTAPLQEENRGRLVVVSSNLAGQEYHLTEREMVLGRNDDSSVQLVVNHRSISANHAKFVCRDGRFTVIDMASANGLIVNGQSMTTTNLVNGDILEMGHVKFRFSGAGDDYQFSPADIDDVILPPSDRLARLAVMVFFFVGIALTGYVITDGLRDSDVEPVDGDEASVAQSNAPPVLTTPAAVELKPDSETQGTELSRTMQAGRDAKHKQGWADAQDAFRRVLEIDPSHAEAQTEFEAMGDELRNEAKLKKFKDDIRRKKYPEALRLAKGFDKASYYYPQVRGEADNVRQLFLSQVRSQIDTDLERGAYRTARRRLDSLDAIGVQASETRALRERVRVAERDAETAAASQIAVKASTPQPDAVAVQPKPKKPSKKAQTSQRRLATTAKKTKPRRGTGCESKVMALQKLKMQGKTNSYSKKLAELSARCRAHEKTQKIACNFFMKRPGDQYKKTCKRLGDLLSSTSQKNALKQKIRRMRRNANAQ